MKWTELIELRGRGPLPPAGSVDLMDSWPWHVPLGPHATAGASSRCNAYAMPPAM